MWFLEEGHKGTIHHNISILQGLAREIFDPLLGLLLLLLIQPLDSLVVKASNGHYKPLSGFAYHARVDTSLLTN